MYFLLPGTERLPSWANLGIRLLSSDITATLASVHAFLVIGTNVTLQGILENSARFFTFLACICCKCRRQYFALQLSVTSCRILGNSRRRRTPLQIRVTCIRQSLLGSDLFELMRNKPYGIGNEPRQGAAISSTWAMHGLLVHTVSHLITLLACFAVVYVPRTSLLL
jgi:hypothetical protein